MKPSVTPLGSVTFDTVGAASAACKPQKGAAPLNLRSASWSRPLKRPSRVVATVLFEQTRHVGGPHEYAGRRVRAGSRHSRTAFTYLSGYSNGALRALFDPDAEVEDCGHTTAAIRVAATCRLALTFGMIPPDQGPEHAPATRTGTPGRRRGGAGGESIGPRPRRSHPAR